MLYVNGQPSVSIVILTTNVNGNSKNITSMGNITFITGAALASGGTNGNTLLLKANDTTFITLTTGATDVCTLAGVTLSGTILASGTVTMPAVTLGGLVTGNNQLITGIAGTRVDQDADFEGHILHATHADFTNPFTTSAFRGYTHALWLNADFAGYLGARSTANGGALLSGIADVGSDVAAVEVWGLLGENTVSVPAAAIYVGKKHASTATAINIAAGDTALSIRNNDATVLLDLLGSGALNITTIELGHATDTTLSRVSAGVIAVEGVTIPSISSSDTLTNKTLTSPTINGTIATTGLTLPAVTLGGALNANAQIISNPAAIHLQETLASDHSWSGVTTDGTAGESLVLGDLCYLKSDGKYWKADADASTTTPGIAIATATIAADASGVFLLGGYMRDDSWNWTTLGGFLYTDITAGALSQTVPSGTGDQIQKVGVALTADIIQFQPSLLLLEVT